MNLPNGTLLQGGKYRIEQVLGQGGFGITYLATNTLFGTRVAIKEFYLQRENCRAIDGKVVTVSAEVNRYVFNSQRDKFRKEALRLQALGGEHIVKGYDFFDENNTSYYVMEYLEGCSLDRWMEQCGGKLHESEVQIILRQILDALSVMHNQHLWHLDIKPNNIMRTSNGNIKLIDFGASKLIDPSASTMMTSSAIASTPGFAPLEQMSGDFSSFGPWTDFYALGATLYILLTGNRPPAANQVMNYGSSAFQFPSTVSQKMRDIIGWMMKPRHVDRPQSVAAIRSFLHSNQERENTNVGLGATPNPPISAPSSSNSPWGWIIAVAVAAILFGFAIRSCSSASDEYVPLVDSTDTEIADIVSSSIDSSAYVAYDSMDSSVYQAPATSQAVRYSFSGWIGNNPVKGQIRIDGSDVTGHYGYNGKSSGIDIYGEYDTQWSEEGTYFAATEYSNGNQCGSYVGQRVGNTISGTFVNYKGDEYDFEWNLF